MEYCSKCGMGKVAERVHLCTAEVVSLLARARRAGKVV